MEPKVSIIVPVYNAEKSLARCVDSILNQEFRDFELILMDDGSKDRSGEICDGYARADARVVVVHKENTGVSDTRNQAIARARGTFLQFVDSDDWLTADATKLMVRAAEETGCDMVIADFYRVVGEMVSQKGDIDADQVIELPEASSQLHRIRIVLHHRNQKSIILFHQNLVILRLFLIIILDKTLRIFRETHMPEMLRLVLILRIQIRQHTSRRRIGDLLRPVIALAAV